MKLPVGENTLLGIKVGLSVGAYILYNLLLSLKSYILFIPLGISFILLGYALFDFQYLRKKKTRLVISYVILIFLSLLHAGDLLGRLLNEETFDTIIVFSLLALLAVLVIFALSILVYFLIFKRVECILFIRSKPWGVDSNFIARLYINSSNNPPIDSLKKITTPLKTTLSLLLLSNILAVLALPLKQYVSLAFVILVFVAAAILPLSKYLKEESGRLSFAYIALLNGSYLMILPAAAVGFAFHYGTSNLVPLLVYIPLALLAVLFLIYFPNRVNINPIIKGILRKMCYERQDRINAFRQLDETEAKKYKNKLYLVIFASLTVLHAAIIPAGIFDTDDFGTFFIVSNVTYLLLAVFVLKRFLPTARVYPLALYYFIFWSIAITFFANDSADRGIGLVLLIMVLMPFFLMLVWLTFVVYEIYRNITESKFVWGDVVRAGTKQKKQTELNAQNEGNPQNQNI